MMSQRRSSFWLVWVGITVFLLTIPHSIGAEPPKSVQILQDLKKTPFYEQRDLYRTMLEDTSVLDHKSLRQEIVKIGREGWFKEYLYPLLFTEEGEVAFDDRETPLIFGLFQRVLAQIPNEAQGYQSLELKVYLTGSTINWNVQLTRDIKSDPKTLEIFLRKGPNKKFNPNKQAKKKDWRFLASPFWMDQVIYETYRLHRDRLNPAVIKKIHKWAWEAVTNEADHGLTALKSTAIAILLDEGILKQKVFDKYKFNVQLLSPGAQEIWTFEKSRNKDFEIAQEYRNEFPRWPIKETSGKQSDQSQGHDQAPGKGHDKKKGEGHTR